MIEELYTGMSNIEHNSLAAVHLNMHIKQLQRYRYMYAHVHVHVHIPVGQKFTMNYCELGVFAYSQVSVSTA